MREKYRVTVDDQENCEITQVIVESDTVAGAIFQAGLMCGMGANPARLKDQVFVRIEKPAGWIEVKVR